MGGWWFCLLPLLWTQVYSWVFRDVLLSLLTHYWYVIKKFLQKLRPVGSNLLCKWMLKHLQSITGDRRCINISVNKLLTWASIFNYPFLSLIIRLLPHRETIIVTFPTDCNNEHLCSSKTINILLMSKYSFNPCFTSRITKVWGWWGVLFCFMLFYLGSYNYILQLQVL